MYTKLRHLDAWLGGCACKTSNMNDKSFTKCFRKLSWISNGTVKPVNQDIWK